MLWPYRPDREIVSIDVAELISAYCKQYAFSRRDAVRHMCDDLRNVMHEIDEKGEVRKS